MLTTFTAVQKTALLLFLGLSATYICLSPGSIAGQGYTGEEIESGLRILEVSTAWLKGHPIPPMIWSRHGPVPVLLDLPFLRLGKRLLSPDFMLSFQPGLLTSALITLLFLWLRKLTSPAMSLFLSISAAFGTMLWPYAYISLETKQSLFVFLAGYLGISGGRIRTWPRLLVFGLACALSLALKSTGIVLFPVIAYVIYVQFRRDWRDRRTELVVLLGIVLIVWAVGHWGTNQFWGPRGGGANSLGIWIIDSPVPYFGNLIGLFGSPTKGLIVYAPILLLSFFSLPRVFKSNPEIATFSLLITICMSGFVSILNEPTADGWGPRYLHIAVAPLILCIGAAWRTFQWPRVTVLVALTVLGIAISFLGATFYYGQRDFAAKATSQNTLEWMNGDSVWNPIAFNARLLRAWLQAGDSPVNWTPKHTWVWTAPPDAMQWKSINLREYCQPQSFLLRFWHVPKQGAAFKIFTLYLVSLILGVLSLIWVVVRCVRDQHNVAVLVCTPEIREARAT
jgi:hypothetical protein